MITVNKSFSFKHITQNYNGWSTAFDMIEFSVFVAEMLVKKTTNNDPEIFTKDGFQN